VKLWQNTNKVICSRDDVAEFNAQWPCSELRDRAYWFEFDDDGNLIDTDVPQHDDGTAASALSQDAFQYLALVRFVETEREQS